ncbi:hypothetical protein HPP92_028567 [Vanilla planifolia]|uniref:Uncharacterized protein n=1 Tax=Vanilla planifolia TaxID=51239 RepID=A0A835P8L3_VANPL|nr:hypothetical protein HPP92_028567 [Vanilla planifolia]
MSKDPLINHWAYSFTGVCLDSFFSNANRNSLECDEERKKESQKKEVFLLTYFSKPTPLSFSIDAQLLVLVKNKDAAVILGT